MNVLNLFPTPLFVIKYDKPVDKELNYLKSIDYIHLPINNNKRSDNHYLLDEPEFKDIKTFIQNSLDKLTQEVLTSKQRLIPTQCWSFINPKGSHLHEHIHINSLYSGVMYFQINMHSAPIRFHKDIIHGVKLDSRVPNAYVNNIQELNFEVGDLVLFPSSLRHSVAINQDEIDRICISFNTFSLDSFGQPKRPNELNIQKLIKDTECL